MWWYSPPCPIQHPLDTLSTLTASPRSSHHTFPPEAEEDDETETKAVPGYDHDQNDDDFGGSEAEIAAWVEQSGGWILELSPGALGLAANQGLRVLSLFDGIGGAIVALKNLSIRVEVLYVSEVEEFAQDLLHANHRHDVHIVDLGDIRTLTYDRLRTLGDIHLVVGGSPCNDLAVTKREREGLDGSSSMLFFEFARVYQTVRMLMPHQVLLLYENMASMRAEDVATITRHFHGLPPIKLNAAKLGPARRNRLYWLNWRIAPTEVAMEGAKLQDVLDLCGKGEAF